MLTPPKELAAFYFVNHKYKLVITQCVKNFVSTNH